MFPILVPTVLKMLQVVGPVTAALPEFKAFYRQVVESFSKKTDQETLITAHRELLAENSGGHVRLQEMLRKASLEDANAGTATDLTGTKVGGTGRDVT